MLPGHSHTFNILKEPVGYQVNIYCSCNLIGSMLIMWIIQWYFILMNRRIWQPYEISKTNKIPVVSRIESAHHHNEDVEKSCW